MLFLNFVTSICKKQLRLCVQIFSNLANYFTSNFPLLQNGDPSPCQKVVDSQNVETLQIVRKHESFWCFECWKQWEFAQFIFLRIRVMNSIFFNSLRLMLRILDAYGLLLLFASYWNAIGFLWWGVWHLLSFSTIEENLSNKIKKFKSVLSGRRVF